jgi:hypothetical protein
MEHQERERIIEILNEHGSMIGNDSRETNELIKLMKQLNCSTQNKTLEAKIKSEMLYLANVMGYVCDKKTNKSRQKEVIAQRDAIARLTFQKYDKYTRINQVVAEFFDKDRTTGIHMNYRTETRHELKDYLFMYYYNKLVEESVKEAA